MRQTHRLIAPWLCLLLVGWIGCSERSTAPDAGADSGYRRPEQGEPVPAAELSQVTTEYLELLEQRRYFAFVDQRAHGWPRSDPRGRYWYSSWWSGVSVHKQAGQVTYLHSADGADNNGLRTAPLLEGACYAYQLWRRDSDALLLRKLIRGFNSWLLAMEREGDPTSRTLMTRAHYPEPVLSQDAQYPIRIDYSLNRPGLDNDATQYVHLADNPTWPDIWIKNKRSKDDLGYMFRAIGQLPGCVGQADDALLRADLEELEQLYRAFCQRVEQDGWALATWDQQGAVWIPPDDLAHFITLEDAECVSILALRLFGRGDPGEWTCGNGISPVDPIVTLNPSNAQMIRASHEAAILQARLAGRDELARELLDGLAIRVETTLDALLSDDPPDHPSPEDMAELLVEAANVGLPLTWREVRYVHDRIRQARASYLDASLDATFDVFDPSTPDGEYSFNPSGGGFAFRMLGAVLGDCAGAHHSPNSKPILDCDLVRAALP